MENKAIISLLAQKRWKCITRYNMHVCAEQLVAFKAFLFYPIYRDSTFQRPGPCDAQSRSVGHRSTTTSAKQLLGLLSLGPITVPRDLLWNPGKGLIRILSSSMRQILVQGNCNDRHSKTSWRFVDANTVYCYHSSCSTTLSSVRRKRLQIIRRSLKI